MQQQQQQQQHPNKVAFQEGVTYILKSWTALKMAVEQEWGGIDSIEKRDWMIQLLVDYFDKNGKKVEGDEIEDILVQIMSDEFQTLLEDDSAYLIAKHLVLLFSQCIVGNFTEVEKMREKFQSQQQSATSCVQRQGDSDEEEEEEEEDMEEDSTGEPKEPKAPQQPDEDGWLTVRRH
ncbi:Pre-rRNA-processing protein TSR2-domain-containing protein [Spinellus fusiger]|nr:Pre-rRNA-processing protein TSR2-domain-containing protein [Spinellus fusiger]